MLAPKKMSVLFVSAEAAPFAKVGGLADVAGALPPALNNLGVDARVIMPFYGTIAREYKNNNLSIVCGKEKFALHLAKAKVGIKFDNKLEDINIWESRYKNAVIYFIENEKYFGYPTIYEPDIKFLFFSAAVIGLLEEINFKADVIHCNDNHTALIPALLRLSGIKISTVLTIHNLEFQGKLAPSDMALFGIEGKTLTTLAEDARDGDINRMLQGILNADIITTVSPTYAKEILTEEYGQCLHPILASRGRDLYGIINGIDMEKFDPETDPLIAVHFSYKNLAGKQENKKSLLEKFSSDDIPKKLASPVIGLISRLVPQKGIDLVTDALSKIFKNHPDVFFIILGTGIPEYEKKLIGLAEKYPRNLKVMLKFDLKTAQEIYAGADIFLMPSKFEPCGLAQLTAMRYGAVPVVRSTGGLKDTVENFKSQSSNSKNETTNGFSFEEYSASAMMEAIDEALKAFQDKKLWTRLMINGMKRDSSWDKSAKEYVELYRKLCN